MYNFQQYMEKEELEAKKKTSEIRYEKLTWPEINEAVKEKRISTLASLRVRHSFADRRGRGTQGGEPANVK